MKKIIVFGASGGTGREVVAQALEEGHTVTVVVRNPDAYDFEHERLHIVKGDVLQPFTFENVMAGKDVVISCLGTQERVPTTVYSEGMRNITRAMMATGVHRVMCLSAIAVEVPPKSSIITKFVTRNILQRIFRHTYADMVKMESILKKSPLQWTVIRPPWLRDSKKTETYRVATNESMVNPSKLSRANLAHYMVHHLDDKKTFRSIIEISY